MNVVKPRESRIFPLLEIVAVFSQPKEIFFSLLAAERIELKTKVKK